MLTIVTEAAGRPRFAKKKENHELLVVMGIVSMAKSRANLPPYSVKAAKTREKRLSAYLQLIMQVKNGAPSKPANTRRRDVEDDRQLRSTGYYHSACNVALNEQRPRRF